MKSQPPKTIVQSPAKVNLHLRILDKRPDGFHNLQTLFLSVDLCDTLIFENADQVSLTCKGDPLIPIGSENLILRAANQLKARTGCKEGARIHVVKRIPMGAGLGGGSSNAATTLLTLNTMWQLGLSKTELMETASSFGSDIPFFVLGSQAAMGEGKGERLVPLDRFPEKWMVLIYPTVSISTTWAYQRCTNILTGSREKINLVSLYQDYVEGRIRLSQLLYNDFEEVVFSRYPEISEIKHKLIDGNAEGVIMTGSGSTVVGFFESQSAALGWIEQHGCYKAFLAKPSRA